MANTTKTTKPVEKKNEALASTPENVITSPNLAEENTQLRSKMEEMEAQMKVLMQQMAMGGMNRPVPNASAFDKDIEVISLTPAELLLTTTGRSDGVKYSFANQFDSRLIPERDLKDIVRSMPDTSRNGYYYINDENFVRENALTSFYRSILDKTEMANLFSMNADDFMAEYNKVSSVQKSIIESMVRSKRLNDEKVDANILMELGKACHKDFMSIEPISAE